MLTIYNGSGGAPVSNKGKIKTEIGAFTVVNQNDTDGDGIVDNIDTQGVRATDGKGKDEVDLMALVVKKPTGMIAGDSVIVTATGPARYFGKSTRETPLGNPLVLGADYFQSGDIKVFFVEIYATSDTLRAVEIEMKYTYDMNKQVATDTVKATGVWVDFAGATAFHTNGQKRHAPDANDETYTGFFDRWSDNLTNFQLGMPPMMTSKIDPLNGKEGYTVSLYNTMEMEYTTRPADVKLQDGGRVKFDITRTIERGQWLQKAGVGEKLTPAGSVSWPLSGFREEANDDLVQSDEDNDPKNQHIYCRDFPGASPALATAADPSGGLVRLVHRMNAQDFVRVTVNGAKLGGNGYQPSRGSELVE